MKWGSRIELRLTVKDRNMFQKYADRSRRTLSQWIREAAYEAIARQDVRTVVVDPVLIAVATLRAPKKSAARKRKS
jgi:uncharacterized protein (DUF1778 family)